MAPNAGGHAVPLVPGRPGTVAGRDASALAPWLGHPEQVTGVEVVEVADGDGRGVRLVRLRTGEVDVDLAVDRALDPWRATVRGLPVGWVSPAGLRHPAYAEPAGWGPMRTFGGGLLTTCGLDHVFGPARTPHRYGHPGIEHDDHPMHGRVSALPARLTRVGRETGPDGVPLLVVEGEVRQAAPFAEHLVMARRVEAAVGGRRLRVVDRVRNDGFRPAPLAVLYHVNVGWPVLGPGARLHLPPSSVHATAGSADERDELVVPEPETLAVEAVWGRTVTPGTAAPARAAVTSDDVGDGRAAGLLVSWDPGALPHLAHWFMPGAGMYVTGLEPSTVPLPGGSAEAVPRLLAPGEEVVLGVDLDLLHGPDDVAAARALLG